MTQHTALNPWFPTEILENLILETWSSSLSVDERISFMVSSLLVSKAWMVAFIRVSSRDVYIPCASYADQFFRILREESPVYDEYSRALPDHLCRSVTLQVHNTPTKGVNEHPGVRLFSDRNRSGEALASTLYSIRSLGYLPHLQRVTIEYMDWGFDDIFDHYRLIAFPEQVTELELKYTFSECISAEFIDGLRSSYERRDCLPWKMPSIRQLTIVGCTDVMVLDVLATCPNVETLLKDGVLTQVVETFLP